MAKVIYGGQSYECGSDSVLDCLTARGVPIPSSCRSGVCQTCLMRAVSGEVPAQAQAGLKPTLAMQNYFLACSCHPQGDIEVALPEAGINRLAAEVVSVERLKPDILGIKLNPSRKFEYRAGQFLNLYRDESTSRSYSLASVPVMDESLAIHVRRVPNGLVSGWLFENLKAGDRIEISEAAGDCFYAPGNPDQDIMLIGTGTGLAPLYGIVRDALQSGHRGRLCLYHGSYDVYGFYMVEELRKLESLYPNFSYRPCVSEGDAPEGYAKGMVHEAALAEHPDLSGWRVFLCGNPLMVNAANHPELSATFLMREIFAYPF